MFELVTAQHFREGYLWYPLLETCAVCSVIVFITPRFARQLDREKSKTTKGKITIAS